MSTINHIATPHHSEVPTAEGLRIGIAVSGGNSNITEPLPRGAKSYVPEEPRRSGSSVSREPLRLVNASARLRAQGVDVL